MKLSTLSSRLKSYKKYLDEESYKSVVEDLNLPSSDFLTKSGGISESKKLWESVSPYEKKSLESKYLPTLTELKKEARVSLKTSGVLESLSGKKEINSYIQAEVSANFKVEKNFNKVYDEWYEFVEEFGSIFAHDMPEIEELLDWIGLEGQKSYFELYDWMKQTEDVINRALR